MLRRVYVYARQVYACHSLAATSTYPKHPVLPSLEVEQDVFFLKKFTYVCHVLSYFNVKAVLLDVLIPVFPLRKGR